jgi:hypothetical protein
MTHCIVYAEMFSLRVYTELQQELQHGGRCLVAIEWSYSILAPSGGDTCLPARTRSCCPECVLIAGLVVWVWVGVNITEMGGLGYLWYRYILASTELVLWYIYCFNTEKDGVVAARMLEKCVVLYCLEKTRLGYIYRCVEVQNQNGLSLVADVLRDEIHSNQHKCCISVEDTQ